MERICWAVDDKLVIPALVCFPGSTGKLFTEAIIMVTTDMMQKYKTTIAVEIATTVET